EVAAKADLVEALRNIYRPENLDGVEDRKRHVAGLNALAEYVETIDADVGNTAEKLRELAAALADLALGIIHPTLRAAVVWDRHHDPSDVWAARVDAALGVEALLRSGMSEADVRGMLSNYPGLKRLPRPNADIKSAPLRWRKTMRRLAQLRPDDARAEAFASGVRVIDYFNYFAEKHGQDWCYRTGLMLLERAQRRAEALVIHSGR